MTEALTLNAPLLPDNPQLPLNPQLPELPELPEPLPRSPLRRSKERIALELGAAFYTMTQLVRLGLTLRTESDPHQAATGLWRTHNPVWRQLSVPPLVDAFDAAEVAGLTEHELEELATTYADDLGEFLSSTSADALVDGINRQLNEKWDAKVAYARASAGYGLEKRGMASYLLAAMHGAAGAAGDLIGATARAIADKALLARADLIGESEAHTATESGKSLAWLYLQRRGGLPPNAAREWDVRTETDCPICMPLDGMQMPLDQPFETAEGRLWGPQAHPNCECEVRLVVPEIAKAYNPNQRRAPKGSADAGEWTRTEDTAYTDWLARSTEKLDEPTTGFEPLAITTTGFEPLTGFTAAFAPANPFGVAESAFEAAPGFPGFRPEKASFVPTITAPTKPNRQTTYRRTLVIDVPPPPKKRHRPHYGGADVYASLTNEDDIGKIWDLSEPVSFLPTGSSDMELGFIAEPKPNPWLALDPDITYKDRAIGRNFAVGVDGLGRQWDSIQEVAPYVWNAVLADPVLQAGYLDHDELHHIAHLAGLEGITSDEEIRRQIINAAHNLSDSSAIGMRADANDGLAWAFADHITFQHPDRVGEQGLELDKRLDAAKESYNVDFRDRPVQQVFVFDQDTHAGDRRQGVVVPNREYVVNEITYRSALADSSVMTPRLFSIGLSEAHMTPYVESKRRSGPPWDVT